MNVVGQIANLPRQVGNLPATLMKRIDECLKAALGIKD